MVPLVSHPTMLRKDTLIMKPVISLDHLNLVTLMEKEPIHALLKTGRFQRSDEYFEYVMKNYDPFYSVSIYPVNFLTCRHYNVMVYFNPSRMSTLPVELARILSFSGRWKMKRVDIALDFPISTQGCFLKPYRNTKMDEYFGDNIYYGAARNKSRVLLYDKKKERLDKGITIPASQLTRLEIRVRADLNKQPFLQELNFDWLRSYFDKYLFLPEYSSIPSQKAITLIQRLKAKECSYSELKKKERLHLCKVVNEHGQNYFEQYLQESMQLFHFVKNNQCVTT
jgi:hypothetical protein